MLKSVFSIMLVLLAGALLSGCLNFVPNYPPYAYGCDYGDWVCYKVRYGQQVVYPRYYGHHGYYK